MNQQLIKKEISESIDTKKLLLNNFELVNGLDLLAKQCIQSLNNNGKIIFCGNGGSFADAQHLSAEFTSRFLFDRPALASVALGTNSSSMSAIGNDYGYEDVFSREIESIANPEDIFIGITTSGNSINVIKALDTAYEMGVDTYVFAGESNGKLPQSANALNVPSSKTARIQECHILMGHIICGIVEEEIFGRNSSK